MAAGESDSNCTFVWSKEATERLIKLYEERAVLYNNTLKEYHERNLRRQALEEIADDLGMTEDEICKKVKSLRAQYGREKHRLSSCPDAGYQSKWHFMPLLSFLDKFMKVKVDLTTVKKEIEDDYSDNHNGGTDDNQLNDGHKEEQSCSREIDSHVSQKPNKRPFPCAVKFDSRKSRRFSSIPTRYERFGQKVSAPISVINKTLPKLSQGSTEVTEDADDIFGKHVAAEIRSIDNPQAKRYAKLCIQNILYEAQSGLTSSPVTSQLPSSQPQFPSSETLVDRYSSVYNHSTPSP